MNEYRAYWATLTGKSEREIYVPAALREPSSLVVGDRIRILEDRHNCAEVSAGDILTVLRIDRHDFETNAPRLQHVKATWRFLPADKGTGWERV